MKTDALLAQLEADPHDVAAFLVYADWLLEHGEPLGELIRVQQAGDHARDLELRRQMFPALADADLVWKLGFPRAVSLAFLPDEVLADAITQLRGPTGRFVESLTLSDYVLPKERALIGELATALPRLTRLTLSNNLELLSGTAQMGRQLLEIAEVAAGKLTHLTLHVRRPAELLSGLPLLPQLQRLTLVGAELGPEDAGALGLARSRVPKTCVLRLERSSSAFAMEDAAREAWPFELESCAGPGLLVEAPPSHRGRYLLARPEAQRIGHHFACALSLQSCGLLAVQCVLEHGGLRPAGDLSAAPTKLVDGQPVELGEARLRYCADVESARAVLRRSTK